VDMFPHISLKYFWDQNPCIGDVCFEWILEIRMANGKFSS
jgi:hypothetical protein